MHEAKRKVAAAGLTNVQFEQADIFNLPYGPDSFDHIFVCFVLEHLSRPVEALQALKRVLKVGGTITVIEGDHGSAYFHPDSEAAQNGNSLSGRTSTAGWRQRHDRKRALSAIAERRL